MNRLFAVFLICMALLCHAAVYAQKPVEITPVTDTVQVVDIIHADRLGFSKRDSANVIQYGAGKVAARQATTLFYSDSAVMNQRLKIFEAFGNVHINDNDSTHTYS